MLKNVIETKDHYSIILPLTWFLPIGMEVLPNLREPVLCGFVPTRRNESHDKDKTILRNLLR